MARDRSRSRTELIIHNAHLLQLISTWHMEIERIWRRKISFVSVCFVIARYWTVIGLTVQVRNTSDLLRAVPVWLTFGLA